MAVEEFHGRARCPLVCVVVVGRVVHPFGSAEEDLDGTYPHLLGMEHDILKVLLVQRLVNEGKLACGALHAVKRSDAAGVLHVLKKTSDFYDFCHS